jgi:hypothetical protein
MTKYLIGLLLAGVMSAQQGTTIVQQKEASQSPSFFVRQSLSSTAGAITIQACTHCNQFVGEYVVLGSSVACNVTFIKDATAASTTAATVRAINNVSTVGYTPPNVYTASNSTGGTQIGPTIALAAGESGRTVDISKWYLGNGWPSTNNYKIVTDCNTGTTDIYVQFRGNLP